ncbi:hypothetical protein LOAG_13582 [Loa loa]|uniref:C2H2-type domain-containing protein n=1 Tax=Loa loa TaxID=7209 RepID=A0A1S0TJ29_LOALO|nr:hypothetical protein LOAG_13582 [Loa loa]EFO14936.1 hypothetical protein LOAG_13582 [Loa loa]
MNFTRAEYLNGHMAIHAGRKPFSCPKCTANFTTSRNLHRHMKIHTDEKSYPCSEKDERI